MGFKLAISGPSILIAVVRSAFSTHRVNVLPDVSGRVARFFQKYAPFSKYPNPRPPPTPPLHPLQQRVHVSYIQLELSYRYNIRAFPCLFSKYLAPPINHVFLL